MRFGNFRYRLLLATFLLAAVIPSCKSPTAPQGGPMLTLILPDSARAFDTVVFRTHYSNAIKPGSKFNWQFGDSTRATTADTSIAHVYDSAGTYLVGVILADSGGKNIAKQSAPLQVLSLNAPMLTLTAPDSVYWGESCVMSISSSQPLLPTWKYTWSFGDSMTFSSQQDSALHWYLNPGTYSVRVELDDTVRHIPLGSRTATVHVVARHFDLALLHTMKKMDIIVHSPFSESNALNLCQPPNIFLMDTPFVVELPFADSILRLLNEFISWNQTGFSQSTNSEDTGFQSIAIHQSSLSANPDSLLTQINYSESQYSLVGYQSGGSGSPFCRQEEWDQISLTNIPFVSESDTDVVFELDGETSHSCQVTAKGTSASIGDSTTFSVQANWNNSSYILIRFHN